METARPQDVGMSDVWAALEELGVLPAGVPGLDAAAGDTPGIADRCRRVAVTASVPSRGLGAPHDPTRRVGRPLQSG